MESLRILLQTNERGSFTPQSGYERVTFPELKSLLEMCRLAGQSLEAELERRSVDLKPEQSEAVVQCVEKLKRSLGHFKTLGRLDERAKRLVIAATKILKTRQTSRDSRVYQTFLNDILSRCGRGLVLLCAASLGKERVHRLNSGDRIELVQYLKDNTAALQCSLLESLSMSYQIPKRNGMFFNTHLLHYFELTLLKNIRAS